ncbi:hypothetical protein EJ03DRAFT_251760, partial [Teratosphaeria nubilosa]
SRLSHEVRSEDMSESEVSVPETRRRSNRFSMLKFRNYSEPQLAARARADALRQESIPPVPAMPNSESVPAIVRTAPTFEEQPYADDETGRRATRLGLFKRSMSKGRNSPVSPNKQARHSSDQLRKDNDKPRNSLRWRRLQGRSTGLEDLSRLSAMMQMDKSLNSAPPSYGDESNSALALPVPNPRFSESDQSDGSNASSGELYGQTTTTTHTVSTHTTFFKLPRHNRNRNSLFPLPDGSSRRSPAGTALQRRHTEAGSPTKQSSVPDLPPTHAALAKSSLSFAEPRASNLFRNDSERSHSAASSPLQPPMRLSTRDRASTTSSFGRGSHDMDTPPAFHGSARQSTSSAGRSSLGGFLSLSRFRHSSGPDSPRHGSLGARSKSNSFAMSREALVIPEREEGDTPGKYLERLEAAVARAMIAGILSKSADPFAQAVLRSYTRRFPFFGEPIDMSLRKFLLEAELPKETQQVDRVIQAFADRYHECNPGIFVSSDQAYIIAFSLMMLHTDAFNKNNKRKMQKQDYIKNTSGQQVADEVLACFYDNICYTPFIHFEEEVDINGDRLMPFKPKKSKLKGAVQEAAGKKPTGPVDPYNLLVEQKLDMVRPNIKETIAFDDPYNYRATSTELDPNYLQRAFTHTGILQIISARSRPTAYEGQFGAGPPPADAQAGIIDLKITKVGTLWRKAAKKKKARSPWQEWGAILTGSQLYLFKNAHWAKTLVHQFTAQQKPGQPRTPVIFKPPLTEFKPDALIKTDNAVALVDATYNRHKHAFTFFRSGGQEEVLLADNESERNDWIALINYAAAFRAAGVRIRGMVGGNEEDLRRQEITRMESARSTRSLPSPTGEVLVSRGGLSPQLQRQVMAARRQIMVQKIAETEKDIGQADRQLDTLLRNARHLLILAPISPKSREDVIFAAARSDANIKWVRRDIWRMKCHKDILALDVQQDGVSASELQVLTSQQAAGIERDKPALLRNGSSARPVPACSPPRSPTSPSRDGRSDRSSASGTFDDLMGGDIFKTPSHSAHESKGNSTWRLPPLQLDVQQPQSGEHRASISTSHLAVSSPGRDTLSQASSMSSVPQLERLDRQESSQHSEASLEPDKRSRASTEEVEMLARTSTIPAETAVTDIRGVSLDGTITNTTPESKHRSGVRRSLQRTLREAHHNSNVHRHRRNKESDSTVRSAGAEQEDLPEGTPSLQREKGRFILHGKQASVVHFGAEW